MVVIHIQVVNSIDTTNSKKYSAVISCLTTIQRNSWYSQQFCVNFFLQFIQGLLFPLIKNQTSVTLYWVPGALRKRYIR